MDTRPSWGVSGLQKRENSKDSVNDVKKQSGSVKGVMQSRGAPGAAPKVMAKQVASAKSPQAYAAKSGSSIRIGNMASNPSSRAPAMQQFVKQAPSSGKSTPRQAEVSPQRVSLDSVQASQINPSPRISSKDGTPRQAGSALSSSESFFSGQQSSAYSPSQAQAQAKEISRLRTELASLKSTLARSEQAAQRAAEQSKTSFQEMNAMQAQQAALRSQLSKMEANASQDKAELTTKMLQAKADAAASRGVAKESGFLRCENESLKEQIGKLAKQLMAAKSTPEATMSTSDARSAGPFAKSQGETKPTGPSETDFRALQQRLKDSNTDAENQKRLADSAESRCAAATSRAAAAEAEVKMLKRRIDELSQGLSVTTGSVGKNQQESNTTDLEPLQARIKNAESRSAELEAELIDCQQENKALSQEAVGLRKDSVKNIADLTTATQLQEKFKVENAKQLMQIGSLRVELTNKEEELASQSKRIKEAEDKVRYSMAEELAQMKKDVEFSQAETESVKKAQAEWKKVSDEALSNIKSQLDKQVFNSAVNTVQSIDLEALKKDLKVAREAWQESDAKATASQLKMAELQEQASQAVLKMEESNKQHTAVAARLDSLMKQYDAVKTELDVLKRDGAAPPDEDPRYRQSHSKQDNGIHFPPNDYHQNYMSKGRPPAAADLF